MFHFGVQPDNGGAPVSAENPDIIPCGRCGFYCDVKTDAVCPLCGVTKRESGYRSVKAND
jgi:rubrerythrin